MKFYKGMTKHPNSGRKKGQLGRKSAWLLDELAKVDIDIFMRLKQALEEKDYQMITAITGFLPYLTPRVKEQSYDDVAPNEMAIEIEASSAELLEHLNKNTNK